MNRNCALHVLVLSGCFFAAGGASAQAMQKITLMGEAADSEYTQQHSIAVGDVPGHEVRVYEIHRVFGGNAPKIDGVTLNESWTRGISDYTNGTGTATNYQVFVLENGDRFFARNALVAQSADGANLTATLAGTITGGTGRLVGIHGTVRTVSKANPKAGRVSAKTDIEYAITK